MNHEVVRRCGEVVCRAASLFRRSALTGLLVAVFMGLLLPCPDVRGQDDVIAVVEKKKREFRDKEEALKQQEKRLEILRKDVEEKIEHYTKLLAQLETTLKKIEQIKAENLEHMVKAYETMTADEAATRLSSADEQTAAKIIMKMKSKKAAAVLAMMEPRKAASLTETIAKVEKKFPTR